MKRSWSAIRIIIMLHKTVPAHTAAQALSQLDRAEEYVAAVQKHCAAVEAGEVASLPIPDVKKLPIGPARQAERHLLRGVAMLGLDPNSEEGARLIRKALAVPEKLAAGLPAEQCEKYLKQFESRQPLANGESR